MATINQKFESISKASRKISLLHSEIMDDINKANSSTLVFRRFIFRLQTAPYDNAVITPDDVLLLMEASSLEYAAREKIFKGMANKFLKLEAM